MGMHREVFTKDNRRIDQVLAALNSGCRTCAEVADKTGMSASIVTNHLRGLVRIGGATVTGKLECSGRGAKPNLYEAKWLHVIEKVRRQ